MTYHKDAEAEHAAQDQLPAEGQATADEHLERHGEEDEVGGEVEDGIGDEVVGCGVALHVWRRHSPVVAERSAPYAEIEDLHEHKGKGDVASEEFDGQVLLQRDATGPND